jgi:homeobox-leucine zipper protein
MMEEEENIHEGFKGKNVESMSCLETPQNSKKKNKKIENKRRFSDEQIRSLECIVRIKVGAKEEDATCKRSWFAA